MAGHGRQGSKKRRTGIAQMACSPSGPRTDKGSGSPYSNSSDRLDVVNAAPIPRRSGPWAAGRCEHRTIRAMGGDQLTALNAARHSHLWQATRKTARGSSASRYIVVALTTMSVRRPRMRPRATSDGVTRLQHRRDQARQLGTAHVEEDEVWARSRHAICCLVGHTRGLIRRWRTFAINWSIADRAA
jgi:hypothetical protein